MKPVVPTVPLHVWKNLYSAAQKFNSLQPWEILDAMDLICLRDPKSGDTGFGVVMGSGGTLFGFCLYRGGEGLDVYRNLMEEKIDPAVEDVFAIQNCLKVEFCSREDMEPEDRRVMKQLNLTFKGRNAWPEFRSHFPGYAPWFLTENEAGFLTLGLNVACRHYERVTAGDLDESFRNDECLMYIPVDESQSEYRAEWEPLPVYTKQRTAPPILNLATIDSLRTKEMKPDSPWEADVFYLPSPILDRERPYYLRITALCHASSGFALAAEPSLPEITEHQSLVDVICSTMEKHKLMPETIFVKNAEYAAGLMPLARALRLTIRRRKNLDAVRELKESMLNFLMSEGQAGRKKK
jgi:hypothetical protein